MNTPERSIASSSPDQSEGTSGCGAASGVLIYKLEDTFSAARRELL